MVAFAGLVFFLLALLGQGHTSEDCEVLDEHAIGLLQQSTSLSKMEAQTDFNGTDQAHRSLLLQSSYHMSSAFRRHRLRTLSSENVIWAVGVWCIVVWAFMVFIALLVTSILPCMLKMCKSAVRIPTVDVKEDAKDEEAKETGNWLGSLIGKALDMYDFKKKLGVEVQVGSLAVYATSGVVEVHDVQVGSPDGYYSNLFELSKIHIDLDMSKLMYSMGSEVVVEKLELDGLRVIIEKTLRTSNLNDFLRGLSSNTNLVEETGAAAEEEPTEEKASETPGLFSRLFSGSSVAEEKNNRNIILREIGISHVGVNLGFYCCAGHRAALRAGDLHYEDFDTQMCKHYGTAKVPLDVIPFIVMTVVRSIMENIFGENLHDLIDQSVLNACDSIVSSAKLVNSTLQHGAHQAVAHAGQSATAAADLSKQVTRDAIDAMSPLNRGDKSEE